MRRQKRHSFELHDESEVGYFLGMRIEWQKYLKHDQHPQLKLSHPGLTNNFLKEYHIAHYNPIKTPCQTVALRIDYNIDPFSDCWEYVSIMGIIMFLSNNSSSDILYAVHQCTRFNLFPKFSWGDSDKHIISYLQGTKENDLIILPRKTFQVDCHVNAEFSGLWTV